VNDSLNNENSYFVEWDYLILENSQTYPTTSVESKTETYIANLTYDSTGFGVITGVLTLNGTEYTGTRTGTGNNAILTANAIMPLIVTETNFTTYWTIDLTNATGTIQQNLTSHNGNCRNNWFWTLWYFFNSPILEFTVITNQYGWNECFFWRYIYS